MQAISVSEAHPIPSTKAHTKGVLSLRNLKAFKQFLITKTFAWMQFSRAVIPHSELSGFLSHHQQHSAHCGFCTAGASWPRSWHGELHSDRTDATVGGVDFQPLQPFRYQTEPSDKNPRSSKVSSVPQSQVLHSSACFTFFLNHNYPLGNTGHFSHHQFVSASKTRCTL